jgi:hypothetical protein
VINGYGQTPQSAAGAGIAIKSVLDDWQWESLKNIALDSPRVTRGVQIKLPCHHLAYLACRRDGDPVIPSNVGSGASISHLCDQDGCIRGEHLEVTERHVDNLERQRCIGVTLIVYLDVIVHEIPCNHGRGENNVDKIASSCRKIRIIALPPAAINAVYRERQAQVDFMQDDPISSSQF